MEIITERHKAPGMIVPVTESVSRRKDEVNRRTHKAGYTDRDGQPMIRRNNGAGKGDSPRPVDQSKYSEHYNKIKW